MGEREFTRAARLAEQLQREIAGAIERDLADPCLNLVTVSEVRLSRDLAHARVSVTVPADGDRQAAVKALNRGAGLLARKLGERLRLRRLPRLRFVHDDRLEQAMRVDALIEEALGRPAANPADRDRES